MYSSLWVIGVLKCITSAVVPFSQRKLLNPHSQWCCHHLNHNNWKEARQPTGAQEVRDDIWVILYMKSVEIHHMGRCSQTPLFICNNLSGIYFKSIFLNLLVMSIQCVFINPLVSSRQHISINFAMPIPQLRCVLFSLYVITPQRVCYLLSDMYVNPNFFLGLEKARNLFIAVCVPVGDVPLLPVLVTML